MRPPPTAAAPGGLGWGGAGGDPKWFADGQQKGAAAKAAFVARVKPQIAGTYVSKWKAGLGWATKTFTNEEGSGERNIRTRAGMPAQ